MSQIESVGAALQKNISSFGEGLERKVLNRAVFLHWKEIAGNISGQVIPVKIVGETLYIYSDNPVVSDQIKFLGKNIIDSANKKIADGAELIKKLDFAKTFEGEAVKRKFFAEKPKKTFSLRPKQNLDEIKLSDEELFECEENLSEIKNPDIKKISLEAAVNLKKLEKWRLGHGWHKCEVCETLCPPKKFLCNSCKISERNKMHAAIRKIFRAAPQSSFFEVAAQVKKKFPHLAAECTLELVGMERAALIIETAAKISFGDTDSDAAKFLVMLYRQIPKEKLTDSIISRALRELRFNLADQPPFETRRMKKFSKPG